MIVNKERFAFEVSLHYELFFALQTLTDPESRIHPGWKRQALGAVPAGFHRRFASLGGSPFLWPGIADVLQNELNCRDFDGMVTEMRNLPLPQFQTPILEGLLHDLELAERMVAGRVSLREAIAGVRKSKQEWLAFIGLYPYEKEAPLVKGLETLLRKPAEFRKEVLMLMKTFWDSTFKKTWTQLQPQLKRSIEEKERLFQSCSLAEFVDLALLRVEVEEAGGYLKAVRGGFRLPLKDIATCFFFPSCFNDKRHWTCFAQRGKWIVSFPYFDPSISIDLSSRLPKSEIASPELDPALIFTALGDSTRYAMVSLLARSSATSADLSRTLSLSRPTVSHHIHVLREAGLLREESEGTSMRLWLKREVLEELSGLAVKKLFDSKGDIEIRKTRKK